MHENVCVCCVWRHPGGDPASLSLLASPHTEREYVQLGDRYVTITMADVLTSLLHCYADTEYMKCKTNN